MKKAFLCVFLCLAALISLLVFPSCSRNGLYTEGNGKLKIVASTFPSFDLARQVAKDKATYTLLQSGGSDLHSYTPTADALAALTDADIFICVGGASDDAWLNDALKSAKNPDLTVIKMTSTVSLLPIATEGHTHTEICNANHSHEHDDDHDHEHDHDHDHDTDEHVWLSIHNAQAIAKAIASACTAKDPSNSDHYEQASNDFVSALGELDSEYASAVSASAYTSLVFADRFPFAYLTASYSICYEAAFTGCSSESEASFKTFARLSEAIEANGARYVLITENGDPGLAAALGEQTGCKTLVLHSMQSVSRSDIRNGVTYLQIMKNNLEVLKNALGTGNGQ